MPFSEVEKPPQLLRLLESGQRLNYPDYCNDETYDIMKECWQMNKDKRPKFHELKHKMKFISENFIENLEPE